MKITLEDSSVLSNLKLMWNTNVFISKKPINESIFTNNLQKVIVGADNHDNRDNIHYNMRLVKFEEHKDYQPPEWRFELGWN